MTWKQCASSNIDLWSKGNKTVTNPKKIGSIFNNYWSAIAEKTKA